MANSRQQKKRAGTNNKQKSANIMFKSSLKRAIKQVETLVASSDREKALAALNLANEKLDKSVSKGIHHKRYVARHKSRLAQLVNTLS